LVYRKSEERAAFQERRFTSTESPSIFYLLVYPLLSPFSQAYGLVEYLDHRCRRVRGRTERILRGVKGFPEAPFCTAMNTGA
jgi:hypothetical protein